MAFEGGELYRDRGSTCEEHMTTPPQKHPVRFLRLVEKSEAKPLTPDDFIRPAWQHTLFAAAQPELLIFLDFQFVTEVDFLTVLTDARPRYVFDLRLVPRFDLGGLNRRLVFSLFAQSATRYVDLSAGLGSKKDRDDRLKSNVLADELRRIIGSPRGAIGGPILFVVDEAQFEEAYISALVSELPSPNDNGWDVLRVPQIRVARSSASRNASGGRDVVFISHANPEDNDFALWLASHLACAGYSVWSDVTKLLGGEVFWDTIENGIRYQSAKIIVALSRNAQSKQGVLDEVHIAVSVERASGLSGFVVPVRVDDLPFDQVRANLARKNVIDFCGNWATGLAQLLESFERDGVPKVNIGGATNIGDWCRAHLQSRAAVVQRPELLQSNWLTIQALPEWILLHQINVRLESIDEVIRELGYPFFRYLRLIGGFAEAEDFQSTLAAKVSFSEAYRIPLQRFLTGRPDELPGLEGRQARNFVTSLVRQGWDNEAAKRGLRSYETASGALVWFLPKGLIDGDRVHFSDGRSKRRQKLLVGRSERRQVYWHFGVEARPFLGHIPRIVLRPHVVFSADGVNPLDSKVRMHVLRRSFCKNWWNDRWRDLILAFVSWFSAENEVISLHVGCSASIGVSSSLFKLEAPISTEGETPSAERVGESVDELEEPEPLDFDLMDPSDEWLGEITEDGDKLDGEPE